MKRNIFYVLTLLTFAIGLCFTGCTDVNPVSTQREDPAMDAQLTILVIYKGAMEYYKDTGFYPTDLPILVNKDYVAIDDAILAEWRFFLINNCRSRDSTLIYIEAISNDVMRDGAGHKVLLDVQNWRFHGYGIRSVTIEDVRINLIAVFEAFKRFSEDAGQEPASVAELIESEYVCVDEDVQREWQFPFVGNNPVALLTASKRNKTSQESDYLIFYPDCGLIYDYEIDQYAWEIAEVIGKIISAISKYNLINGEDPSSVEKLQEEGYITIDEFTDLFWSFTLIGINPICQIEAVSTEVCPIGAGHVVLFDIRTGSFSGYSFSYGPYQ